MLKVTRGQPSFVTLSLRVQVSARHSLFEANLVLFF